MKTCLYIAALLLGAAGASQAATAASGQSAVAEMERVSRIHAFPQIDGWRPIDDETLIIWATPLRPYLVKLSRRSFDLRFTNVVGVTSTAGTIYEKFDDVVVDGLRYPIKAIYKLDARAARSLHRRET